MSAKKIGSRKSTTLPEVLPTDFNDLCGLHPPRPINDAADYENTAEVAGRLAALSSRSEGQAEYLETLTILIEKYDSEHFGDDVASDAIARLKRLMENHDMSGSDLGHILGNRGLGNAILRGDRKIS